MENDSWCCEDTTRSQPKTITLEMTGDPVDLQNEWWQLYRFLSDRANNVDFEYRQGKITFYMTPRTTS